MEDSDEKVWGRVTFAKRYSCEHCGILIPYSEKDVFLFSGLCVDCERQKQAMKAA